MQTKRIKCPNCGVVLDVKNSKNEQEKLIVCPQCQAELRVKFPQQEPLTALTYIAAKPNQSNDGATQLAGSHKPQESAATQLFVPPTSSTKRAVLMYGGKTYPLKEGKNIVGRMATTSQATVQIETTDRYMSRQQCIITVSSLPGGEQKVLLSNYQNKNATSVDGQELADGDVIRLVNGNSIKMGKTIITFKIS